MPKAPNIHIASSFSTHAHIIYTVNSKEGGSAIVKISIPPSPLVANPMYSEVRQKTGIPISDTTTNGDYGESGSSVVTIRRMSNPLYGDTDNSSSPERGKTANEGLYSVPRRHSPTSSNTAGEGEGEGGKGGWIYIDPDLPPPQSKGEEGEETAVYSYATVGGVTGNGTAVQGNAIAGEKMSIHDYCKYSCSCPCAHLIPFISASCLISPVDEYYESFGE